jgi:hypothetical protein|tara:strand:- start:198 stop:401 length:204 start_codon:yes stop_codon:yes gene_type:complete
MDIDTLQRIRHLIRKEIEKIKEHLCYGIDKEIQLHYSKGKLNGLESLLQDLKDLQNREDNVDDIDQT